MKGLRKKLKKHGYKEGTIDKIMDLHIK